MIQWTRVGTKEVNATITVASSTNMQYCYLGNIDCPDFQKTLVELVRTGNDIRVNSVNSAGIAE